MGGREPVQSPGAPAQRRRQLAAGQRNGEVEKIGFLSPNASREYGRRDGNRALVHTSFEADGESWTEELYYDDLEDAIRQARERKTKNKATAK